MAYEVLARKWRPQQFDDVVGQTHVTETLKNAITSNRLAHAYLFVGPRGIGKTSIARIFAKALNCVKGPGTNPCGKCDSCTEIAAGNSLDVLEIDGASNNGVEQIRDLRETVKYMPTKGSFKIYIIDEVHMLSVPAFNALLKTLEEPPPHVKFMFATTEPDKILATIISRCQRFDLRRIEVGQIAERLQLIARAEKVTIDDDAVLAIARGSEGGLRDAESALEQLISFKGKTISEADVLSVFGLVSRERLEKLATSVLGGDIKSLIEIVSELDDAGKDLQRLVLELMEHFRHLLVCLNVDDPATCMDLADAQIAALVTQAEMTNTDRLLRVTRILGETVESMRFALSRRTLLETALIRCARAAVTVSLEEVLKKLNEIQASGGDGSMGGASATAAGATPAPQLELQSSALPERPAPTPAAPAVEPEPGVTAVPVDAAADLALLKERWAEVVSKAGRIAVMTAGVLRDSRPLGVTRDGVAIGIDPEFEADIDKFTVSRNRKAVEHAIRDVLGRDVAVTCEVADVIPVAATEPAPVEEPPMVSGALPVADEPQGSPASAIKTRIQDWVRVPEVEKVLDMFNGTVIDVRA